MSALDAWARPAIGRGFRLQWEPAQNAHVLLYPEGMVKLNASAGEILRRCDGARTLGEIVAELQTAFGVADVADICVLSTVPSLVGTPDQNNLLLISQASSRLLKVSRTGAVLG